MNYPEMLNRFTTPLALACETGENPEDVRDSIDAPRVTSIVWVTDSGEARYFESLQHLYDALRVMIEAEDEGDYRPAVYEARAIIDAMASDGVREEYTEAFREILASIEGGES